MKNLFPIFFIAVLSLLLPSCKSTKGAAGKKLKKRKAAFLLEELNKHKKTAEWLSAKAAIKYKDDHQRMSLTSHIRVRKDSVIWLNVKKLGIEAARVQITPDSIIVLDRINKQYIAKDFSYVSRQFSFPTAVAQSLDFQALQAIFLGNPVFIPVQQFDASIDAQRYLLSGQYEDIDAQYWLQGSDYELSEMTFQDHSDGKNIGFQFGAYQTMENGQNFSYFRAINLKSTQTGNVDMTLQLSKVEIDVPTTIRFEIPSRYTKMD